MMLHNMARRNTLGQRELRGGACGHRASLQL
jgi:hypothetical protein